MAQALTVEVLQQQTWPQGDIRDPLGVWGARLAVTGDASGGEIKVVAQVPAARSAAYVYTCYNINASVLASVGSAAMVGVGRLLANWPNIDQIAGIQGFASHLTAVVGLQVPATPPSGGVRAPLLLPNDRFILLYDPRPGRNAVLEIAEARLTVQVLNDTYSFEFYGYFWDRSVMDAPGGPRHPGS